MPTISEKIRAHLEARNMSIAALAMRCGVTRTTIDNILYGKSHNRRHLQAIAEALAVPLHVLLADPTSTHSAPVGAYFRSTSIVQRFVDPFDARLFEKVLAFIQECIEKTNLLLSPLQVNDLSYDAYLYLKNHQLDENKGKIFIDGMLHCGMKIGMFRAEEKN